MHPENIVVIGPTSSGKTNLANAIASHLSIPIFNCDAIQIYEDLNLLSNKPEFVSKTLENGEPVCFTNSHGILNFPAYAHFKFAIIRRKSGQFIVDKTLQPLEFFRWLIRVGLIPEKPVVEPIRIKNYLFDIRKPRESYSLPEFKTDVQRICTDRKIDAKLIAGGTIYYAYHYLMGTDLTSNEFEHIKTLETKRLLENKSINELLEILAEKDPQTLAIIDIKNKVRLMSAVAYIEQTGMKYSEQYIKKPDILDDFLLIMIVPQSRETYVEMLNNVVARRINKASMNEIGQLEKKYGGDILDWVGQVSYEYRYSVKIYKLLKDSPELSLDSLEITQIIEELQAKERQYTKRQLTFMRKLHKDLIG